MDNEGRIRYAGSTVQQNHGETTCKGFLIWNINNKKEFNVKPITITKSQAIYNISLNGKRQGS